MGDRDKEDAVVLLIERVAKSLHDNRLGEVGPQRVGLVSVPLSLPRSVEQKCPCREEGGGEGEGRGEGEGGGYIHHVAWQNGMVGVHCMWYISMGEWEYG